MDQLQRAKRFNLKELTSYDALKLLEDDVRTGLFDIPRSLPPKYFYDDEGSKLFEAICKTHDYYPTRTEAELLNIHAEEIVNTVNPVNCVELGAGTSTKTEILLAKISSKLNKDKFTYISIDVCKEVLVEAAHRLLARFKNINISAIAGEYIPAIRNIPERSSPVLYLFLGSSIGNFSENEAVTLLSQISQKLNDEDHFLIGMDRTKDKGVLEQAYDDSEGVTSEFNINVLRVLNSNLGCNFNINNFKHQAIYNDVESQIEMYLISRAEQEINFPSLNRSIFLKKGEKILTEVSRKYSKESIKSLLKKSGLIEVKHFEPKNEYFSLVLAKRSR